MQTTTDQQRTDALTPRTRERNIQRRIISRNQQQQQQQQQDHHKTNRDTQVQSSSPRFQRRGRGRRKRQQSVDSRIIQDNRCHNAFTQPNRRNEERKYKSYIQRLCILSKDNWEHEPDEKLLDAYDYEHMDPLERWNQEQLDDLERTSAKDRQMIHEEDEEHFEILNAAENYDQENRSEQVRFQEEWNQLQVQSMQSQFSTSSYTTITDELEQLRQIRELELSDDEQVDSMNKRNDLQLRIWEESLSRGQKHH